MRLPICMKKSAFILTTGLMMGAAVASGSQVVLTNGEIIEGEIVEQNEANVTIRTLSNTLRISRSRIQEINADLPGSSQFFHAREELRKGNLDQAKSLAEEALEAGADEQLVMEFLEQIRQRQAKEELARHRSLLVEARQSAERGERSEAIAEVRRVLAEMDEDNPARKEFIEILVSYHLTRANEFRDKVRNEQALQELKAILELDPTQAKPYLELADIYKSSSATWQQAVEHYHRALQLGEGQLTPREMTRAYWELGELNRQQYKWREAATYYREAYLRDPAFDLRLTDRVMDAMRNYAQELLSTNKKQALSVAEEGLKIRDDEELRMLKGRLLQQLGRHAESTETFQSLLDLHPKKRMANYHIAQNFLAEGDLLSAREYLQREIEIYPGNYDALALLGDLALQREDYEAAQRFFSQARSIDPDIPRASLGLGRTYRQQKQLPEARQMVLEVLARLPEDREATLEMGKILVDEKNLDEARRYFTSVLDLIEKANPEDKENLQILKADALIARGEIGLLTAGPGTANVDFQKALEAVPNYAHAYYSIGQAYREKYASSKRVDDLVTAEENLLRARELRPNDHRYALAMGILYAQDLAPTDPEREQEYRAKATEHWRDYIELGGPMSGQVRDWIREIGG